MCTCVCNCIVVYVQMYRCMCIQWYMYSCICICVYTVVHTSIYISICFEIEQPQSNIQDLYRFVGKGNSVRSASKQLAPRPSATYRSAIE